MDTFEKGVFNAEIKSTSNLNDNSTEGVKPIWAREINPFSADAAKCPGCGSNLVFDPNFQSMVCNNCGGLFHPKTLTRISESKSFEIGDMSKEDEERHEISCNSCGAKIVADKNTSATSCPFCGSPALIISRLSRKFEPDYIIPFKYGKEEAKKEFIKWAKSNKFIQSGFASKQNIENITGIYVPFWLVDAECSMNIDGIGNLLMEKPSIAQFDVHRECSLLFSKIPFDGSRKWDDTLMEAIEPYDYKDLKPYHDSQGYLSGFMAERYDLTHIKMSKRIVGRIKRFIREESKEIVLEYDRFTLSEDKSLVDKMDFYYCLAPIWFVNYNYNGTKYQFVMNGQTGRVAGDVPISIPKKAGFYAGIIAAMIALAAVVLVLCGFVLGGVTTGSEIDSRIRLIACAFILSPVIFAESFLYYFMKEFRFQRDMEMDKPKASEYIVNTKYEDLIKKDKMMMPFNNEDTYEDIMWDKKHPNTKDNVAIKYSLQIIRAFERGARRASLRRRRGWF